MSIPRIFGRFTTCLAVALLVAAGLATPPTGATAAEPADIAARARHLFRRDNLVAWCIVPFDAKKRGPEERAAMLEKAGFKHFAYDWRPEHIPTFDREWDALVKHGVALDAFWSKPPDFPGLLASLEQLALALHLARGLRELALLPVGKLGGIHARVGRARRVRLVHIAHRVGHLSVVLRQQCLLI